MRGMRNPLNSWAKNDSKCACDIETGHATSVEIGPNDLDLCRRLIQCGTEHRKVLRQINITMDITAPLYWWAELDTYKICTTRNSCSFQHKGASKTYELSDFSFDDISGVAISEHQREAVKKALVEMMTQLNILRSSFNETKDYNTFRLIRQLLPCGYNYKATWSANMEVLLNIYRQRKNHKLIEWHMFIDELKIKVPYFAKFCEFIDAK